MSFELAACLAPMVAAENPCTIGNLLLLFSEPQDDKAEPVAAAMQPLAKMINGGAPIHA